MRSVEKLMVMMGVLVIMARMMVMVMLMCDGVSVVVSVCWY